MSDLSEIRDEVMSRRWDKGGITCPCCTQLVKVYRRKITGRMARTLFEMFRRGGTSQFVKVGRGGIMAEGGDYAKLALWGLIESGSGFPREDGSNRVGWWRVTQRGANFLAGDTQVPKYIYLYNDDPVPPPPHAQNVFLSVRQITGSVFSLQEAMATHAQR